MYDLKKEQKQLFSMTNTIVSVYKYYCFRA